MAQRGAKCSESHDIISFLDWDEVKTEIIYYFTDNGEKANCLSIESVKESYAIEGQNRPMYIRMNNTDKRRLFLLPNINQRVDDSFLQGILRLSNVFYVYPRYRAIPVDNNEENVGEEITVYVAIPVSTEIFMNTELSELRNRMNGIIDKTIISLNACEEIKEYLFPGENRVDDDWGEEGDWEEGGDWEEPVEEQIQPREEQIHPRELIDEEANYMNEIIEAIWTNNLVAFRHHLREGIINPFDDDNFALQEAIRLQRISMVDELLEDPRIDLSENDNIILQNSMVPIYYDRTIFEMLLDRIIPTVDDLLQAVIHDNLDAIITMRARYGNLRFLEDDERPLEFAIAYDSSFELFKFLVEEEKLDPSIVDNTALTTAIKYGRQNIVEYLLADERVDPSDNDNEALIEASKRGEVDMVRLLLADERVDPSARNNEALATPNDEIIGLITRHPRYNRPN
jgi:hypothetical protein